MDLEYECVECGGEFGLNSELDEEAPDYDDNGNPRCWACAIKVRDKLIAKLELIVKANESRPKINVISDINTIQDAVKLGAYKNLCDDLTFLLVDVIQRPCNKRHHDMAKEIYESDLYKTLYGVSID